MGSAFGRNRTGSGTRYEVNAMMTEFLTWIRFLIFRKKASSAA